MTNFKVICFAVATSLLFKIINPELLQDLVHRNILKFALKKIPLISILAKCKLERLALSSELVKYRKGQCINYRSLEEVEKMFVVLEGTLTNVIGYPL